MTRAIHPIAARALAKAWRANPNDRARIERLIAVSGRQDEFTFRDGIMVARITPAIRAQITASGGGGYRGTSEDRRFWAEMTDPAIVSAAGMGFQRSDDGFIHLGFDDRAAA